MAMALWYHVLVFLLVLKAGFCTIQSAQRPASSEGGSLEQDGGHGLFKGDFLALFDNATDLLEWYLEEYQEGVYHRHLAAERLDAMVAKLASSCHLSNRSGVCDVSAFPGPRDLSVAASGHVSAAILSLLGGMARVAMLPDHGPGDDGVPCGGRREAWGEVVTALATRGERTSSCDELARVSKAAAARLRFASRAVERRIGDLLRNGYVTTADEDKALLAAAEWEGARATPPAAREKGKACASCWWEQGRLTSDDTRDLRHQLASREWLRQALAQLARDCPDSHPRDPPSKEPPPTLPLRCTDADNNTLNNFLVWCEARGLDVNKKVAFEMVVPAAPSNYEYESLLEPSTASAASRPAGEKVRSVMARQPIKSEEIVCTLPHELALFDREAPEGGNWDTTAAALVRERRKGDASMWHPYIAVLPCQDPSALSLTVKEVLDLQWWPAIRETIMFRKAARQRYLALGGASAMLGAPLEEYMWAAGMVNSRAYTLPVGKGGAYVQYAMIPFVDMINHHHHKQADYAEWASREGASEVITRRRVKEGEQVYMSFGPRSNDKYLIYFGFALDDNPFDSMPLFSSFEAVGQWHMAKFGDVRCRDLDGIAHHECMAELTQSLGEKVTSAIKVVESAGLQTVEAREWWDFIGGWGIYGYEYLPYRPSPDIRPGGLVDPSLLSVLISLSDGICSNDTEELAGGEGAKTVVGDFQDASAREAWNSFCRKAKKGAGYQGQEDDADIRGESGVEVLGGSLSEAEEGKSADGGRKKGKGKLREAADLEWRVLVARAVVAIRCREVLGGFPTTIEEDERLLERGESELGEQERRSEGEGAWSKRTGTIVRYRLHRKRMLRTMMEKMEGRIKILGLG